MSQQQQDGKTPQELNRLRDEEKQGKKHEHKGELGAVGAGAFGMHEGHEKKKDPEHERRHKIGEEVAGAGAVGSGGCTAHEHHQVKNDKHSEKECDDKKHHHVI